MARRSSPLVIGIGQGEYFIGSDATPIVEYTDQMVYLKDNEIAIIRRDAPLHIVDLDNVDVDTRVQTVAMNLGPAGERRLPPLHAQGRYSSSPTASTTACAGASIPRQAASPSPPPVRDHHDRLLAASRFIIVACGTSWHAGLIGKQLIESLCRMPVEVEYASEFRYRTPVILPTDVVIAISQSGETADTLAAVQLAKEQGAFIYGICNAVGSSLTRITDTGSYIHVGPEIGVASTKAFTGQVTVLTLLALALAQEKGMPATLTAPIAQALATLPGQMKEVLAQHEAIGQLSRIFTYAHNFLYLGRGYNYPVPSRERSSSRRYPTSMPRATPPPR